MKREQLDEVEKRLAEARDSVMTSPDHAFSDVLLTLIKTLHELAVEVNRLTISGA